MRTEGYSHIYVRDARGWCMFMQKACLLIQPRKRVKRSCNRPSQPFQTKDL